MNSNYFDKDKTATEYLYQSGVNLSNAQVAKLEANIEYLTLVQSSFLEVIVRDKKRIFIESSLVNGKSTALILHLLTRSGKSAEAGVCPIIPIILPNKSFIDKFIRTLQPFLELLAGGNVEISFVSNCDLAAESVLTCDNPSIRVVVGTIKDVITFFRQNDRAIEHLDTIMIDDLDLLVSLGQTNNVKRFIEYVSSKRADFFNSNRIIITVKEDILEEITAIKDTVNQKFVNIRITRNFEEEIAELDQQKDSDEEQNNNGASMMINQYFHINAEKQLYCMIYLLLKFEVYAENYLIIAENINDAYKIKLFLERSSLTVSAKVYNPTHPITLKAYFLSLYNSKQNDILITTKEFMTDLNKLSAKLPTLRRVRNILFVNCTLNNDVYSKYTDFLENQPTFLKSANDFNIIHLVSNDKDIKKANGEQDDEDEEAKGALASFNELANSLAESGIQLEPLPINKSDVQLFEYRINEVLQTLSRSQIKLYQLIEVKKLMLKSKKMKAYFVDHQSERDLLLSKLNKMVKQFKKHEVKLPSDVPSYLTPSFLKAERKTKVNKLDYILKRSKKETPLTRDAKTLSALGSHKQWKIRHKIKKMPNKRRLKKGLYDI